MIKNIVMDMGNVLIDYAPQKTLERYCRSEEEKRMIMEQLFCSDIWIMGDRGEIVNDERYALVKEHLPESMHGTLRLVVDHWQEDLAPMPGAEEFVRKCRADGYRMYVLSNACQLFYEYFPRNIDETLFDGIMVSSSVKLIKPDPRIYELLCSTYDLIPEECVFIDDRPENVEAARGIGMKGIVFTGSYGGLGLSQI